jgi:hypothetical protein
MGLFTHYLTVIEQPVGTFKVRLESNSALPSIKSALSKSTDLRYSPLLPAYLKDEPLPAASRIPEALAFFFSQHPYEDLGAMRPDLSDPERDRVFFTQGLASIVLLDFPLETTHLIRDKIECSTVEIWTPTEGFFEHKDIITIQNPISDRDGPTLTLAEIGDDVIDVYIQQISASVTSLWASYTTYYPEERNTLLRILKLGQELITEYVELTAESSSLRNLKERNAIISGLVELSAALSYSVTQGTSGASPILSNRSPFPHHSLLGVGGAVRALTKFTRYLEAAFNTRSAADIIEKQYSAKDVIVPASIPDYDSGQSYAFALAQGTREEFDTGGEFLETHDLPLLAHFSLRHGFKEAKFSLTAASESLTAESLPAWTLMTLSHEIMHSRVRDIFCALFGESWLREDGYERWERFHADFNSWYKANGISPVKLDQGIRNVVLNFCLATERANNIVQTPRATSDKNISPEELLICFLNHGRLASELFVHFHDYYFAYAGDRRLYTRSLWASWTTVASPVARPIEYLVRTLATIACGTGAEPSAAFDGAVELLLESLESLESVGFKSPLYDELRSLVRNDPRKAVYALFKPAYYLIDQVRLNFASAIISRRIDHLDTDPFADGSTVAEGYQSSIYVYGEPNTGLMVSPIRYSLAGLVRQLSGAPPISDLQWLTAWNDLIISSLEVIDD